MCPRCRHDRPLRTGNAYFATHFGGRWEFEIQCPVCLATWRTRTQQVMNLAGSDVMKDMTNGEQSMRVFQL